MDDLFLCGAKKLPIMELVIMKKIVARHSVAENCLFVPTSMGMSKNHLFEL